MKKILLLSVLFLTFSCTKEDIDTGKNDCGCVKEYWIWYPAMNGPNGSVLVPERREFVFLNEVPCGDYKKGMYLDESGRNYNKVIYICK